MKLEFCLLAFICCLQLLSTPIQSQLVNNKANHNSIPTRLNSHNNDDNNKITQKHSAHKHPPDTYSLINSNSSNSTIETEPLPLKSVSLLYSASLPALQSPDEPLWSYDESAANGPQHWHALSSAYKACNGLLRTSQQSPINIQQSFIQTLQAELEQLQLVFNAPLVTNTSQLSQGSETQIQSHLINTGQLLAVAPIEPPSYLTWKSRIYRLESLMFHQPSEHTLEGVHSEVELQLYHVSDTDERIIVSVFMNVARDRNGAVVRPAANNSFLDSLQFSEAPLTPNASTVITSARDIAINVMELLPVSTSFFHYSGSLTVPPCTENVEYFLLKHHVLISAEQFNVWHRLYGNQHSHRPIQPLNGRNITQLKSAAGWSMENQQLPTSIVSTPADSLLIAKDTLIVLIGCVLLLSLILIFSLFFLCLKRDNRNLILQQAAFYRSKCRHYNYDSFPSALQSPYVESNPSTTATDFYANQGYLHSQDFQTSIADPRWTAASQQHIQQTKQLTNTTTYAPRPTTLNNSSED